MKTGIELITEERTRQVEKEGWSLEHDSLHKHDELARAAAAYALPKRFRIDTTMHGKPRFFPWALKWWKPNEDNRIHELVKAGALIAAEIDRINNTKS